MNPLSKINSKNFKWNIISINQKSRYFRNLIMHDEVWEKLLASLSSKVDKPTMALLKSLKPISLEKSKLIIQCPTEQAKNWINQTIGIVIRQEIAKVGFSIELIVKENTSLDKDDSIYNSYKSIEKDVVIEGISEKYNFDNFIVGKQNEVAYKCALDVAINPNSLYNPLFIYGKIGSGKTHLLQAIGNKASLGKRSVIYTSMNDFTEEMVYNLKAGSIIHFREKYKNIDILLIDDIQFLSGKERTQIELFNIFNYLFRYNKHIVFASDKHPREIKDISERLISRFEGGLLVETGIDDQIKLSIIEQKIKIYDLNMDDRLISYIKDNTTNNAREIEGLVLQIKAKGKAMLEVLNDQAILYSKRKEITPSLIKEVVANYFNINVESFLKSHKNKKNAVAKHIAIYLLREYTTLSLTEIAKEFNIKSHSSINHSIKKINSYMKEDKTIQYSINSIKDIIKRQIT